ncbi:hypothetical protein HPB49_005830 [Dermacentor silvarum]|uniref:Uncharacterized protein n=1 Tax=Dermacentor silvarum TaxID=543639 RepID=A0ACB8CDL5_DERSI|nr:hypothetical protein HPB49_005830 [Dermacentor silvarum]
MSLHDLMVQLMEELGDPHELTDREDFIVLKLQEARTSKRLLPEDIELNSDSRRFSMSQRGFVTHRAFLGNLRYPAALFAGCREFSSSKEFLETAKYVLKNARSLVIVHNRNSILDLVTWFPAVTTVVLYHNLRLEWEIGAILLGSRNTSRMEKLLGTTPILGLDTLLFNKWILTSLLHKCPKLDVVMSPYLDEVLAAMKTATVDFKRVPVAIKRRDLFLGSSTAYYTGSSRTITVKNDLAVEEAHRHFAEAEHLELSASCESALEKVASYAKVTHLSLAFDTAKPRCAFKPHVTKLLSVLRLVQLSLTNFCEVKLSTIAIQCPQLKTLRIFACDIDDENTPIEDFTHLEYLRISSDMKEDSFFTLLRSCPGLQELHLGKVELTTAFVVGPSCAERPSLEHVQRLTLGTSRGSKCALDDRNDLPSVLDSTLLSLPSLRFMRTDNFNIRLHIASCFPRISLEWCRCTFCFAEFPKITYVETKAPGKEKGLLEVKPQEEADEAIKAQGIVSKKDELKIECQNGK